MAAERKPPRRFWAAYATLAVIVVMILGSFAYTYHVDHAAQDRTSKAQCASITQVKNAALELTRPTSEAGVTDENTLARIRVSNAAKGAAAEKLKRALACT